MAKKKENDSATEEPRKEPGRMSRDPSRQPTPNVLEQEKNKKRAGIAKDEAAPNTHAMRGSGERRSHNSQTIDAIWWV
jgi:hypothetical protein